MKLLPGLPSSVKRVKDRECERARDGEKEIEDRERG